MARGMKKLTVRNKRFVNYKLRTKRIWNVVKSAKAKVSPLRIHVVGCLPFCTGLSSPRGTRSSWRC